VPASEIGERMAAADLLRRADRTRPTRTLPGRGGNTLGGPGILTGLTSGGLGGLVGALTGAPIAPAAIAGTLGVPPVARFIGNRMTSDPFTRSVIHPPGLAESFVNRPTLSRILTNAAVGAMGR
jgi:hypothetical protein